MAAHEHLGKQFKRNLHDNASFDILDSHPETYGSDWSQGGCRIAATALHRMLPGSSLHAIWSAGGEGPEHYVVHHEGKFYDDRGAQSESLLMKRWNDPLGHVGVPNPVLRPTTEEEMERHSHSIVDPTHESGERSSDRLVQYLTKRMKL